MKSYLRVLRHPNFRFLFAGQAASIIGDRVVVVAIALFVTQATGSATDLALVLAAQSLPLVALLLLGGVWADRLPRRRGEPSPRQRLLHELRVGWREVRSRSWVWVTIAVFAGAVLCAYAQWYALAPVIARRWYGGAGVFGLLESVAGLGAIIGALAGIRWRPARPLRTGLLLSLAWPLQG